MVMFFSGFTLSSAVTLLLYRSETILDSRLHAETKVGISLGTGVLCGLVTMLVSSIGLLVSGLQLGSLLSLAILVIIGQSHSLTPTWVSLSTILAFSIFTAVFTLHWQKFFAVVYTSVLGAAVMMLCLDYLLGTFMLPDQVHDILSEADPRPFCWYNWVITGTWPVMSFIGLAVQWSVSARGVSHTGEVRLHFLQLGRVNIRVKVIPIPFSSTSQTKEISEETWIQRVQKKTSVTSWAKASTTATIHRRCAGPGRSCEKPPIYQTFHSCCEYFFRFVFQSYLRRLQEHQMGTGSSTSSVSTITHTLIDFDFETGSMVPLTTASPVFTVWRCADELSSWLMCTTLMNLDTCRCLSTWRGVKQGWSLSDMWDSYI